MVSRCRMSVSSSQQLAHQAERARAPSGRDDRGVARKAARGAKLGRGLTPRERRHVGGMAGVILLLNVLGWGLFIVVILPEHYKVLGLGVAVTAYTLGMRHAFDADHIAAIDNTTRKLMAQGKRPLSVGFFFSLGHSTMVFALGVGLSIAAKALIGRVESTSAVLQSFGGLFGTLISASSST